MSKLELFKKNEDASRQQILQYPFNVYKNASRLLKYI